MGLSDIFENPLNLMVDYHKFPTELSILCRLLTDIPMKILRSHWNPMENQSHEAPWKTPTEIPGKSSMKIV